MENTNKYYEVIKNIVVQHRKYSGLEPILDDIIDDVYKHSCTIIDSVQDKCVIETYLQKVVSTSIITVPKKLNFHTEIKHRVINTKSDVDVKTCIQAPVENKPVEVEENIIEVIELPEELETVEENNVLLETNIQDEIVENSQAIEDNIVSEVIEEKVVATTYDDIVVNNELVDKMINSKISDDTTETTEVVEEDLLEITDVEVEMNDEQVVSEESLDIIYDSQKEIADLMLEEQVFSESEINDEEANIETENLNLVEEEVSLGLDNNVPDIVEENLAEAIDDSMEDGVEQDLTLNSSEDFSTITHESFLIEEDIEIADESLTSDLVEISEDIEISNQEDLFADKNIENTSERTEMLDISSEAEGLDIEEQVVVLENENLIDSSSLELELELSETIGENSSESIEFEEIPQEDLLTQSVYKTIDYSLFNYEPDLEGELVGINEIAEAIKKLDAQKSELKMLDVYNLKYKDNLTVSQIAKQLDTKEELVLEALSEIISVV